jgi:glycosyltransferase involved in cell wall biosynthesis
VTSPTVSIVVPTHQRAATVDRLLRCLIDAPPTTSFEVIVVDNASTDGTDSIVKAAAESLPSLQFHRWPENVGPLENWKRGIERASGQWLKIIWSDDWVEPGAIDRLVTTAVERQATTVTCGARLHHESRTVDWYTEAIPELSPDHVIRSLLELPAALPASPTAALVPRATALEGLRSVNLAGDCSNSAIGPDVVLTYWDVFTGGRGIHIDEPLVNFGLPDDSITLSSRRGKLLGCYASSLWALIEATNTSVPDDTLRRLRHRGTLASLLGGTTSVIPTSRKFSIRAAAADVSGLTRYAVAQRRRGSS